MRPVSALRYLWLTSAPRPYFIYSFGALALMGIVLEFTSGGSSDFATIMILVLQMFAVSTGFASPASRGYLDPVLTSRSRTRTTVAHFAAAVLPGTLAWLVLAAAEVLRAGSLDVTALHASSLTGLFLISAVAWAATLPLPPLSGGGLWFLVGMALLVSGRLMVDVHPVARDPQWFLSHPGRALFVALSFPILLPSAVFPAPILAALVAIGILALVAGALFVRHRDFSLAEEG